jgi:hypothetical protein
LFWPNARLKAVRCRLQQKLPFPLWNCGRGLGFVLWPPGLKRYHHRSFPCHRSRSFGCLLRITRGGAISHMTRSMSFKSKNWWWQEAKPKQIGGLCSRKWHIIHSLELMNLSTLSEGARQLGDLTRMHLPFSSLALVASILKNLSTSHVCKSIRFKALLKLAYIDNFYKIQRLKSSSLNSCPQPDQTLQLSTSSISHCNFLDKRVPSNITRTASCSPALPAKIILNSQINYSKAIAKSSSLMCNCHPAFRDSRRRRSKANRTLSLFSFTRPLEL